MSDLKPQRFELRLRSSIDVEAELLKHLDTLDGYYGGKTELLRDCLRHGIVAMEQAISSMPQDAKEHEILEALGARFSNKVYSHRIGKLFLDARKELLKLAETTHVEPAEQIEQAPVTQQQAAQVVQPQDEQQQQAQSEPEPQLAQDKGSQEPQKEQKERKAPDWSNFRGMAGRGDN